MKTFALLVLAVLLPGAARAQVRLRIEEVGLQGHCSTSIPTPVRVRIPALPQSQTIDLLVNVDTSISADYPTLVRTDHFEKQVSVTAGQPLDVDLPILLSAYGRRVLRVAGTDSRGQKFGEAKLELPLFKPGPPIAIYCRDDAQCFAAQNQIATRVTGPQTTAPRSDLQFVFLKELRSDWLVYRMSEAVVIAGSMADMTPDQGKALEYFLRSGGTLVLVEKEAANSKFLAAYPAGTDFVRVGRGNLYRIPSLESQLLTKLFSALVPNNDQAVTKLQDRADTSAIDEFLGRIGISFTFPRLRWLLIWVGIYILVIGPLNFAWLKRLRKLEWGWVTMAATAVFFAAGIYVSSSSHRPRTFTLDGAVIYSMDAHSPVAVEHYGFRISSPDRRQVGLTVNDDVILASQRSWNPREDTGAYVGSDLAGRGGNLPGWQMQLAPPLKLEVPMRRWSFTDFYAEGFHEFPGTVHWTSPMHLRNDTGLKFCEALYFDIKANLFYPIHGMEPNQEVDLAAIVPKQPRRGNKPLPALELLNGTIPGRQPLRQALTTEESQLYGMGVGQGNHVFVGEVESPVINARLDAAPATQQNFAVVTVALDQP